MYAIVNLWERYILCLDRKPYGYDFDRSLASHTLLLTHARPNMSFLAKFAASKYVGDKLEENFGPEVYVLHYFRIFT